MRKIEISMSLMGALAMSMVMLGVAAQLAPRESLAKVVGDKEVAAPLKAADRNFILEAATGGMAEVELGQLARERGDSEVVKTLGLHMIDDHSKLNDELAKLASKKGVAMPAEPQPKHKAIKNALAKLSGPAFDKQYVREMVKDHEGDLAEFEKQADRGRDPELTIWVKQALPTLQNHLAMSRDAEAKISKAPPGVVDKVPAPR